MFANQTHFKRAACYLTLLFFVFCFIIQDNEVVESRTERRLQAEHLLYQGAFRVPHIEGEGTFSWGGTGIAYHQENHSLFIKGHNHYQLVGEISIPIPVISASVDTLPTASLLQPCVDITEGNLGNIGEDGANLIIEHSIQIGGLLDYGDRLLGTIYAYYENADNARRSHFTVDKDFTAQGDFQGVFTVGDLNPGYVAGYMAPIPVSWQSKLGGTVLTGQGGIPLVYRTSLGPSAFSFNPNLLGVISPTPAQALVYYPETNPTLGPWANETHPNPAYNMATSIYGVIFPQGSDSVLFFGKTGLGIPQYGTATADPDLVGQLIPGTQNYFYIYDPASQYQGNHAWPYAYYIWAYDAHELAAVVNGTKEPWEVLPYDHWSFELPFKDPETDTCELGGAAYDPVMNRLYLSQLLADEDRPVIHVFDLNL